MYSSQAVEQLSRINVFGSSIVRTSPDIASLVFAVTRIAQHPKDAFREAHTGAQGVRTFLAQAQVNDVGSSRVTLTQTFRYTGGESRFIGYTAKVAFHVLLHDLDQMENVLSGIVDAGANEINAVALQTSRLKELRAEARRRAIAAAREKAVNYCTAAGVALGSVIHIQDINPDTLRGQEGHSARESEPASDDEQPLRAFDPGSITVGGAVVVTFEIVPLPNG